LEASASREATMRGAPTRSAQKMRPPLYVGVGGVWVGGGWREGLEKGGVGGGELGVRFRGWGERWVEGWGRRLGGGSL
jgi:hypothetical protein